MFYRNNHDGTFNDTAETAGVSIGTWSAGATFGDYDGDGRLDLFVDGYLKFDLSNPPYSGSKAMGFGFCQYRGEQVMCGPRGLVGEQDHLFHNNGDGTFTDVSKKLGVDNPAGYYGLGALFADVNGDGKMDLLVANDSTPNYLYINKGNGTFEDASYTSGFALNNDGREVANMGLAAGDYENNGHLSIVSTTFSDDYNVLFQNDGTGFFTDVSYQAGIAVSSIPFVGFGDGFLDYDNDGWKDLLIINGHVYPEVDRHPDWGTSYAERPLLYHNVKNGKFELVPPVEGTGLAHVSVGRGAAFGDIFNDGKIDVVINNMDGIPTLLRNVNPDHHHWVDLKLIGGPRSPRDAVGATVYLNAAGIRQRGDVLSGGSYLSSNDMRITQANFLMPTSPTTRRPMKIWTRKQWADISLQAIYTYPDGMYCDNANKALDGTAGAANVYLEPIPDGAYLIETFSWQANVAPAALTTAIAFPDRKSVVLG